MKINSLNKVIVSTLLIVFSLQSCTKDSVTNDLENPISANQQTTGTSANDLLSDITFKSLIIEIAYVDGFLPTQEAIDNFVSFLDNRTYKPDGISVITTILPSSGNSTYTTQDIVAIEDANRTAYNSDSQIAVWAFFSDGESASNSNNSVVLGTAYRNTSFVIYEKTIHEFSNSSFEPNRSMLETTVITHEFGHILGLTNLGTDMQTPHEDTEHQKHCNIESCLMYWSSETGSGIDNLMDSEAAPQLDAQCIADLQANGGK
jgi:hypothetical protein